MHKEEEKDALDLSFLLNLLDGTLEANGRILIITTNFPERIDRALIRRAHRHGLSLSKSARWRC
jgi:chaperone BCS1